MFLGRPLGRRVVARGEAERNPWWGLSPNPIRPSGAEEGTGLESAGHQHPMIPPRTLLGSHYLVQGFRRPSGAGVASASSSRGSPCPAAAQPVQGSPLAISLGPVGAACSCWPTFWEESLFLNLTQRRRDRQGRKPSLVYSLRPLRLCVMFFFGCGRRLL